MERDMDLVKLIMERSAATKTYFETVVCTDFEGYDSEVVAYHMQALQDAGLIDAEMSQTIGRPLYGWVRQLTWAGHDMLCAMRNETIWKRVKEFVKKSGGVVSLEVMKALCKDFSLDLAREFMRNNPNV